MSMDWFKGKFYRKTPWSSWENLWFPVDFPLNESIEYDDKSGVDHMIAMNHYISLYNFYNLISSSQCYDGEW